MIIIINHMENTCLALIPNLISNCEENIKLLVYNILFFKTYVRP
jgi:hypothetical protein